jgi:hypothetical protein
MSEIQLETERLLLRMAEIQERYRGAAIYV